MLSTAFVRGEKYSASSISAEVGAFVRIDDGTPAHVSRAVSAPEQHAIIARDQIGYRGSIPAWVAESFQEAEQFLVFLEEVSGTFAFLGLASPCTFRSVRGVPREIAFFVPDLPTDRVAALAPQLLERREAVPWWANAFIEMTRTAGVWEARALGYDVSSSSAQLLEALANVETPLAEVLLARARRGGDLAPAPAETASMRSVGASLDEALVSHPGRIIVRVGYFSADLEVPGWSMSRDEIWVA